MLYFVNACCLLLAVLVVSTNPQVASAADPQPAEGVTTKLFDGKSLQGWTVMNDCQIVVDQENILLKGGNGWLRSDFTYGDFKMHIEWKAEKAADYDSGIYVRTGLKGKDFPKPSYQINLLQAHEGEVKSIRGATPQGFLIKGNEWNSFDVTAVGNSLEVAINGKPAYRVTGLKEARGYVGIQCEVIKGGSFRFRNISITELDHHSLFNGRDLTGWEGADAPAEKCWLVDKGDLVCTGKKGPWLRSDKQYDDFNLRFDYQISAGGNSGVFVRVPADGNHHVKEDKKPAGFEVQIIDDKGHKDLKDYQYTGSVYDIAGANPHVGRPLGDWNSMEINAKGQHITITHNGVKVVDAPADKFPLLNQRLTKGFLGLQNHSTPVRFRNIRVGAAL